MNISPQTERTFLITGANAGIGQVTALELARAGGHVILACRSPERAQPVIDTIRKETGNDRVELLVLDLASLDAVRTAAHTFLERDLPLHVLINNAGLGLRKGLTEDGFEIAFGVNHLGHFLFTLLLLPRLLESGPDARIVNVASRAHKRTKGIDFERVRTPGGGLMRDYAASKLANVLFTRELARRLGPDAPVTVNALHPGVVASEIWRRIPQPFRWLAMRFMISNEEGAEPSLAAATDPQRAGVTGRYYDRLQEAKPAAPARDEKLARELWEHSITWTDLSNWENSLDALKDE